MRFVTVFSLGMMALICVLAGLPGNVGAFTGDLRIPPEGVTQVITLESGSSLVGRITEIRAADITFQTEVGDIKIDLAKVKSISEVKAEPPETPKVEAPKAVAPEAKAPEAEVVSSPSAESYQGNTDWFPNPNRTRLLLGPTARTLKAGDAYLYDLWIFFPGAAYGITDDFMISAGVSVIPDADDQMFYIIPKLSIPASEQVDLAASLMIIRLWEKTSYFGLGNATYGTDDRSLSVALGIAFTDDEVADKPVAMLGGEYRTSARMSLVGEGWFIPGDDDGMLGFGGVRLMGELMTVDLGFALSYEDKADQEDFWGNPEENEVEWIPYVDFVWNF